MDLFNRIKRLMLFKDLSIGKKFTLYTLGATFWLLFITSVSTISLKDIYIKTTTMIENIIPQSKTVNIMIRKLRGSSISMYKMLVYDDLETFNENIQRAKIRLKDIKEYAFVLLNGGVIRDYSRGTGQYYERFIVKPLKEENRRKLINRFIDEINQMNGIVEEMQDLKLAQIADSSDSVDEYIDDMVGLVMDYDERVKNAIVLLTEYGINIDRQWQAFSRKIKNKEIFSIIAILSAFVISGLLALIFGMLITRSFSVPLKDIISQIRNLSSGEIDLTTRLNILSKDEIGVLSREFNKLIDSIANISTFKNVIEEDNNIETIYQRLGKVLLNELFLLACIIYEVIGEKKLKIVFPPEAQDVELYCKKDIFTNNELCRAFRSGNDVFSLHYPDVCKSFVGDTSYIYYCIPIIIGGKVGGIIQLVCAKRNTCMQEDIMKRIKKAKQYIREALPVLEAKHLMQRMKESSIKDPLTGLYNRRYLEEVYDNISAGVLRRNTKLGILLCDIDYFKETNDTYGHDIGDRVLKKIAEVLLSSIRRSDISIRYGGEEFLILLLDIKDGDPFMVAEKIRKRVEETKIKTNGDVIKKTISIGVCEFPTDADDIWEGIKFADLALYKAKQAGRNKVVRYNADLAAEMEYVG